MLRGKTTWRESEAVRRNGFNVVVVSCIALFIKFIFNWKIAALQCCVDFFPPVSTHGSTTGIHICPLSLGPPSCLPPLHTPLGCHRAQD